MFKVQSTPEAASLLALKQRRPFARDVRMSAESGCPVDPITIIRAACARHLGMASDRRVRVSTQANPLRRFEGPTAFAWVPVFLTDPPRGFVGMTAARPSSQLGKEYRIHPREGGFSHHSGIIVTPALDDGIEAANEDLLGSRSESPHFMPHLLAMGVLTCG